MDYGLSLRLSSVAIGNESVPIQLAQCWFRGQTAVEKHILTVLFMTVFGTLSIATRKQMVCPYTNPVLELLPNAGVAVMLLMMLSTSASFSMLERVNSAY